MDIEQPSDEQIRALGTLQLSAYTDGYGFEDALKLPPEFPGTFQELLAEMVISWRGYYTLPEIKAKAKRLWADRKNFSVWV